jgi:predicted DNA-binding transcriptional regulator AlpA
MSDHAPSGRILDTEQTRAFVRKGKTRFSQLINDTEAGFPRPIVISGSRHGFFEDEVVAWMKAQPRVPIKEQKPSRQLPDFFTKAKIPGGPRGRPRKAQAEQAADTGAQQLAEGA